MSIGSQRDLIELQRVGRVVARALAAMKRAARPGVTTAELDAVGAEVLKRHGARSAPAVEYGFPGCACISVGDEVAHGVPGARRLQAGDVIKLDVTAELGGYVADAAITVILDGAAPGLYALAACARRALLAALEVARAGEPIASVGLVVEREAQAAGFDVVRELCGHGVGRRVHEEPSIPNFFTPRTRGRFTDGLVVAIEPILAERGGGARLETGEDGWTLSTRNGAVAVQEEHTAVIRDGRPLVVTAAA
jgi:methionyl aminopeptidase